MTPHVLPNSEFASRKSSSLSTRFGTAASVAGRTNAARPEIMHCARNAIHTPTESARSSASAATPWPSETSTRILFLSNRSAAAPATGERRNDGKVSDTNTNDTRNFEPVRSSTSPASATKVNQSPRYDTTWAMKRFRTSPLRRRRENTSAHVTHRARESLFGF